MTVAPITTTVRGLSTDVRVGTENGLAEQGVVACDHIAAVPAAALGRQIGRLLDQQETDLTHAVHAALGLN